jgi:methionine aminotransferase
MKSSSLKPLKSEGTFFQLYDYSNISDENDLSFAKRLTIEYGVASIPVSPFYSKPQDSKHIRLCFAKTDETLSAAAERLCSL